MTVISNIYLGLGSNLSPRHRYLEEARAWIEERVGRIIQASSIAETKPWGFESSNDFLNQIIIVKTFLAPMECLRITQDIEQVLGRRTKSMDQCYVDRCIDIDILLWGEESINLPDLMVPHPRIAEREFIIRQLEELKRLEP